MAGQETSAGPAVDRPPILPAMFESGGRSRLQKGPRPVGPVGWVLAVFAIVLVSSFAASLVSRDPGSPVADHPTAASVTTSGPSFPTPIHHVMVIFLENEPPRPF